MKKTIFLVGLLLLMGWSFINTAGASHRSRPDYSFNYPKNFNPKIRYDSHFDRPHHRQLQKFHRFQQHFKFYKHHFRPQLRHFFYRPYGCL